MAMNDTVVEVNTSEPEFTETSTPSICELEGYAVEILSSIATDESRSIQIQAQEENTDVNDLLRNSQISCFQCSSCFAPFPNMSGLVLHLLGGCVKQPSQQNGTDCSNSEGCVISENGSGSSDLPKCEAKTYQCASCLASFPSLMDHLVESVICYQKTCEPSWAKNRYRMAMYPSTVRVSKYDATGLI